ncbi:hypothetical protein [Aliiruegeria sabulilitoris]|uniref:hypothetical protein n=1 Tax=Aliiruegeria sabulilitoris TaxID=1510458 RepID=UPI0012E352EB|nr:hypothetical protein [Aliiruegeria sabulilitoris]
MTETDFLKGWPKRMNALAKGPPRLSLYRDDSIDLVGDVIEPKGQFIRKRFADPLLPFPRLT